MREEAYPVSLTPEEVRYLEGVLRFSGHPTGLRILEKIGYEPPRFPVGACVRRKFNSEMCVVIGHQFRKPGVWTARLRNASGDEFGVGEVYLESMVPLGEGEL